MFIRMIAFEADRPRQEEATQLMDQMLPKIRQLPGCKESQFIMHETDGHYALLVFWETKEAADAAAGVIGPMMIPSLNRIANKPVEPRLYKVY